MVMETSKPTTKSLRGCSLNQIAGAQKDQKKDTWGQAWFKDVPPAKDRVFLDVRVTRSRIKK
jgi:hypothetical protein